MLRARRDRENEINLAARTHSHTTLVAFTYAYSLLSSVFLPIMIHARPDCAAPKYTNKHTHSAYRHHALYVELWMSEWVLSGCCCCCYHCGLSPGIRSLCIQPKNSSIAQCCSSFLILFVLFLVCIKHQYTEKLEISSYWYDDNILCDRTY